MPVFATLPVIDQDVLGSVRLLLARLLQKDLVTGVLVAAETNDGHSVRPALIRDSAQMVRANPLLPVLPVNGARLASLVTRNRAVSNGEGPTSGRLAVVMRPCELRATVELAKLRQVNYAGLLTIGLDCIGTYEIEEWQDHKSERPEYLAETLDVLKRADPDPPDKWQYRPACKICATPVAWHADISLHLIGIDGRQGILVETADESLLQSLELVPDADPSKHQEAVRALISLRQTRRQAALDVAAACLQPGSDGRPGLVRLFETCQGCLNCTVACPICYCKTCLFRTETFAHQPDYYLDWAARKGAMPLPGDTLAFQMTRLVHVSTSCVGCGLCTSACPANLPVDTLFQTVGRRTQELFDYVPGRDLDEPIPVSTFQEEEFSNLGEPDIRSGLKLV
jgi:formate dehydrogenase subunit beta